MLQNKLILLEDDSFRDPCSTFRLSHSFIYWTKIIYFCHFISANFRFGFEFRHDQGCKLNSRMKVRRRLIHRFHRLGNCPLALWVLTGRMWLIYEVLFITVLSERLGLRSEIYSEIRVM